MQNSPNGHKTVPPVEEFLPKLVSKNSRILIGCVTEVFCIWREFPAGLGFLIVGSWRTAIAFFLADIALSGVMWSAIIGVSHTLRIKTAWLLIPLVGLLRIFFSIRRASIGLPRVCCSGRQNGGKRLDVGLENGLTRTQMKSELRPARICYRHLRFADPPAHVEVVFPPTWATPNCQRAVATPELPFRRQCVTMSRDSSRTHKFIQWHTIAAGHTSSGVHNRHSPAAWR